MGFPSAVRHLVTTQSLLDASIYPRFRSLAIPLEEHLRGRVRYALQFGSRVPVLLPDNTTKLTEDVARHTQKLLVARIPSGIQLGGYVTLALQDAYRVVDVDDVAKTITIDPPLRGSFSASSNVFAVCTPLRVDALALVGDRVLTLDVPEFLVRGDLLAFPVRGPDGHVVSFLDNEVTSILQATTEGNYTVELANPIQGELAEGVEIYLRANPAYSSNDVLLPHLTYLPFKGPYAIDLIAHGSTEVDNVLTVERKSSNGAPIAPTTLNTVNSVVAERTIHSEQFYLFRRERGRMELHELQTVLELDSDGRCQIVEELAPSLAPASTKASGRLVVGEDLGSLADNQTVTILGHVFEFAVTLAFVQSVPGSTVVELPDQTPLGIARHLWAAIGRAGRDSGLGAISRNIPRDVAEIILEANVAGSDANDTITTDAPWLVVSGMIGGFGRLVWQLPVTPLVGRTERVSVFLDRESGPPLEFSTELGAVGAQVSVTATLTAEDGPVTGIRVFALGDPGSRVLLGDLEVTVPEADILRYDLVIRGALGEYDYASSALAIKQLVHSTEYLIAQLGRDCILDSGIILE